MFMMIHEEDGQAASERRDAEAQEELAALGPDPSAAEIKDLIETFAQNHELCQREVPELLHDALKAERDRVANDAEDRAEDMIARTVDAVASFRDCVDAFASIKEAIMQNAHEELDVVAEAGL